MIYGLPSKIEVKQGSSTDVYDVNMDPVPHIIKRDSKKKLHGWWPGKRECTAERLLINPYNGCTHDCFFCYAHAFRGYFEVYAKNNIVTVFEDFDKKIAKQLDSMDIASAGYLSPVADPFQPINSRYRLSEKIIKVFVERNLPVGIATKGEISNEVLLLMKTQRHSFGQVSILTTDEGLRKMLVPKGKSTQALFKNLQRMASLRIHAVCRIDPIIPLITDSDNALRKLVKRAALAGANHIVASCLDIPVKSKNMIIESASKINPQVKNYYNKLFSERIDGYLHANCSYRKRLFSRLRNLCDKMGLTFALCMEYEYQDGIARGLNSEFMSSTSCEGIDIPIYFRNGDKFFPAVDCRGNCLNCDYALCGIDDLAMGKNRIKGDWKLEDYHRWAKELKAEKAKQSSLERESRIN